MSKLAAAQKRLLLNVPLRSSQADIRLMSGMGGKQTFQALEKVVRVGKSVIRHKRERVRSTNMEQNPLVRKLSGIAQLNDDEKQAVQALCSEIREVDPKRDIISEGETPEHVHLIWRAGPPATKWWREEPARSPPSSFPATSATT